MSSCFVVERLEFKARLNNYEFCNSEQNSQAQFLFRLNDNNNITCLIVFLWELNEIMHKSTWKCPWYNTYVPVSVVFLVDRK